MSEPDRTWLVEVGKLGNEAGLEGTSAENNLHHAPSSKTQIAWADECTLKLENSIVFDVAGVAISGRMKVAMEPSEPNFCHPYQPYDIQLQFMSNLYQCIENGKVGIFESPTGTGKSLSLICSSLTWLRDHKRRALEPPEQGENGADGVDWLVKAEQEQERQFLLQQRQNLERELANTRIKDEGAHQGQSHGTRPIKKAKPVKSENRELDDEDAQYMLEEYLSDDDKKIKRQALAGGLSDDTRALMDKLRGPINEEEDELLEDGIKIVFCSRTHSQLTQFVNELRRVEPPFSIPPYPSQTFADVEMVKHLSLGSRKNLCINPKVSRLSSTTAVNERCLEIQKPGVPKEQKCPYVPTKESKKTVEVFRNRALARIRDIEDLGKLGQEMEICPYYASRAAIAPSEVLTLPYPLLLQKAAREALGVSIKGNIVIIDEAHNLMDAIADSCSVTLTADQLDLATSQVTAYVQKFKNRLKGRNRVYVTQVIRLLNSIADCLRRTMANTKQNEIAITPLELMSGKGVDQIRPHQLVQYLQESKLAQKVDGYVESKQTSDGTPQKKGILLQLQSFLIVLMNPEAEGRFFITRDGQNNSVRYTLLDPREHFRDVVQDARAVILAGGTMSPVSDYADYLFSYLPSESLRTFSFGHVIPPANLYAQAVVKGPSGLDFDFTFEHRRSEIMMSELGKLLIRVCRVVPDGLVVFFPSYDYLSQVVTSWKASPAEETIFSSLTNLKRVFEESKGGAVDELLRDYANAIDTGHGGLMLSVVGGKLSEGINFSDKLGRTVVAVGLPFPNINGAEWKSKIEHVENTRLVQLQVSGTLSQSDCRAQARAAGREFYENACMRAVNQCVGRAIRHKNDYAAILLVDRRYATNRIESKLPLWIRESMDGATRSQPWNGIERRLRGFFAEKQ